MPLSHLYPGMTVLVRGDDGTLAPTIVDSVEHVSYSGPVYDLEVDRHHSYVAERRARAQQHLPLPRRGHPQHPRVRGGVPRRHGRSCSSRTTGRRRRSSTRPTRSSPTTSGASRRTLWTDQGHGEPIVRYHADDEGDEAQWVAHQIARPARRAATAVGRHGGLLPHQRAEPRGRRAAHARRHPVQGASAAPGSTTGARSRTRSPTCGRWSTRPTR